MVKERKIEVGISVEMRIGRRIKALRCLRNMDQKELADLCNMSNQTLSRLENGKTDFKIGTMKKIEKVLRCTLLLVPDEDIYLDEQ